MKSSGKVAVVTAAAGAGIGQACARALAQAGANVVVAGSSVFGKKDRAEAISDLRKAAE